MMIEGTIAAAILALVVGFFGTLDYYATQPETGGGKVE